MQRSLSFTCAESGAERPLRADLSPSGWNSTHRPHFLPRAAAQIINKEGEEESCKSKAGIKAKEGRVSLWSQEGQAVSKQEIRQEAS